MSTPIGTEEDYFIKPGYGAHSIIHTRDEETGGNYWNDFRIGESRVYQLPVYDLAEELIEANAPQKVADIGCGVGTKIAAIAERHPQIEFFGYDQESSIAYCNATHKAGRWTAIDLDDDGAGPVCQVDLAICSDVIEHVERPEKLLQFVHKTLKPSGILVISTPERDVLRGRENLRSPKKEHVREWNRSEFSSLIEHFGFDVVDWQLQFNVRPALNKYFLRELWGQVKRLRSPRYNQVFVVKRAGL